MLTEKLFFSLWGVFLKIGTGKKKCPEDKIFINTFDKERKKQQQNASTASAGTFQK